MKQPTTTRQSTSQSTRTTRAAKSIKTAPIKIAPLNPQLSTKESQPKLNQRTLKAKINSYKWFSVAADLIEYHTIRQTLQPFFVACGILFGITCSIIVVFAFCFNTLTTQYYPLIIQTRTLMFVYAGILSLYSITSLIIYASISRKRFSTIHQYIPYTGHYMAPPLFLFILHTLIFSAICGTVISLILVLQPYFASTLLLASLAFIVCIYRTLLRSVIPITVFEHRTYLRSIRLSSRLFLSTPIHIIRSTLTPLIIIFGVGILGTAASEYLWSTGTVGTTVAIIISILCVLVYSLYYIFFGFTLDYLSYIHARLTSTTKTRSRSTKNTNKSITYTPTQYIALSITFGIICLLPFFSLIIVSRIGTPLITATQNALIAHHLRNEKPLSLTTQSIQQPFATTDTVSYRGIEFSTQHARLLEIQSEGNTLMCVIDTVIKNTGSDTLALFPHLTINLYSEESNQKLPHYYDVSLDKSLGLESGSILNSYAKYRIPVGVSLVGAFAFDCTSLSKNSTLRLEYDMIRVQSDAIDANLNIDQYREFESQRSADEYRYARMIMHINPDSIKTVPVAQTLPTTISLNAVETISVAQSRFCRVNYTITNNWTQQLGVEFYMITLTDSAGAIRPKAYIGTQFDPNTATTIIPSQGSKTFTQDFNCQDGGANYTLTFTPYQNFGSYITETSSSTPVVVQ